MPRYTVRKSGKKTGPYKTKPIEKRGITGAEMKIQKKFWREHNFDEIMSMDFNDLDNLITKFMQDYEDDQRSRSVLWWYPENAPGETKRLRNTPKHLDKPKFN